MVTKYLTLPKANYQGYIWYSDRSEPEIIETEFHIDIASDTNPFIAEAFLLDIDRQISHSIKFVDGEYLFNSFKLNDEDYSNYKVYKGNHMNNRDLRFTQRWKTVKDSLCCDMITRIPAEMVFVGFDKD